MLPNAEVMVAATGLALRTHSWGFLGVHGVSNAVGTRVSNELGAGNHGVATLAVKVSQDWCRQASSPFCLSPLALNGFPAGDSARLQLQCGELFGLWRLRLSVYACQHTCRWG